MWTTHAITWAFHVPVTLHPVQIRKYCPARTSVLPSEIISVAWGHQGGNNCSGCLRGISTWSLMTLSADRGRSGRYVYILRNDSFPWRCSRLLILLLMCNSRITSREWRRILGGGSWDLLCLFNLGYGDPNTLWCNVYKADNSLYKIRWNQITRIYKYTDVLLYLLYTVSINVRICYTIQ